MQTPLPPRSRPPPWKEWQTLLKILPWSKLRLVVVINDKHQRKLSLLLSLSTTVNGPLIFTLGSEKEKIAFTFTFAKCKWTLTTAGLWIIHTRRLHLWYASRCFVLCLVMWIAPQTCIQPIYLTISQMQFKCTISVFPLTLVHKWRLCLHLRQTSRIGSVANRWWCSCLTVVFSRTRQEGSKKNANVTITFECTFMVDTSYG